MTPGSRIVKNMKLTSLVVMIIAPGSGVFWLTVSPGPIPKQVDTVALYS